jgi:hypothetical protein
VRDLERDDFVGLIAGGSGKTMESVPFSQVNGTVSPVRRTLADRIAVTEAPGVGDDGSLCSRAVPRPCPALPSLQKLGRKVDLTLSNLGSLPQVQRSGHQFKVRQHFVEARAGDMQMIQR